MILDQIVARKREELAAARTARLHAGLAPVRPFILRRPGRISIIAEIKRASPAAGAIRSEVDPARVAAAYQEGGAVAVSVLTDSAFFGGSRADLALAREGCGLPVLRKDFIIDEAQLIESRAMGADAALLIARILTGRRLEALHSMARKLGMAVLVEVHEERELDAALEAGAEIVGINNRNLDDFSVSLETTLRLRPRVPADRIVVSESGISTRAHVAALEDAGVDAVLIGEALMRAGDPILKLKELMEARS